MRVLGVANRKGGVGKTTTALTLASTSGPAYQSVAMTVTVSSTSGTPQGSVTIRDGASRAASGVALVRGVASVTTNSLGPGSHSLSAEFAGIAGWSSSASAPVLAVFGGTEADARAGVVTIPAGALTITTSYSDARPLDLGRAELDQATSTYSARASRVDIAITDTRAGNLGFTATVVASPFVTASGGSFAGSHAGLVGLTADQVPGNALRARDVRVVDTRPGAPGLGGERVFAHYPAGVSLGTTRIHGTLAVAGVPSSVPAGRYAATLTFTAM